MQLADLLFLLTVIVMVVIMGRAVRQVLLRGWAGAARALAPGALLAVAYSILLLGASAVQPGLTVPVGQPECFDDWCITVTGSQISGSPAVGSSGARLVVRLRVSNGGGIGSPQLLNAGPDPGSETGFQPASHSTSRPLSPFPRASK